MAVIGPIRFSYLHVFEPSETPSGDMKFSACCLIPMDDATVLAQIDQEIKNAVQRGLDKNVFSKAQVRSLRMPLRNGTEEHEAESRGPEFKDHMFFNASTKNQPEVVDSGLQPIMDMKDFYSGCYGYIDCNFFPYNVSGNRGIGVGLNSVMKSEDGERLDGRMKAADAFAKVAAQAGLQPEGDEDLT